MRKVKHEPGEFIANDAAATRLVKITLVEPRSHDCLVKSKATEAHLSATEDQFGDPLFDDSSMLGLQRALSAVKEFCHRY
jgi:hypothetical protein